MEVVHKAPGKVILSGEHSVVYGGGAITLSLGMFKTCTAKVNAQNFIHVVQPSFRIDKRYSLDLLKDLSQISTDAIGLILHEIFVVQNVDFVGIDIEITSDLPTGGFGSSTALIESVVGAVINLLAWDLTYAEHLKLLIDIEEKLQGYRSSGMEQIAVLAKGLVYMKKHEGEFVPAKINTNLIDDLLIVSSGKPQNTTGEVVKFVHENLEKNEKLLAQIATTTEDMRTALHINDKTKFEKCVLENEALLEDLGIVSETTAKFIAEIKNLGGVAKVSGAGTIHGNGSGAVIVFAQNFDEIRDFVKEHNYEHYFVKLAK